MRGLDPARLAVVEKVGSTGLRFEFYCASEREALALVGRFGGSVLPVKNERWLPAGVAAASRPISFGRHLVITGLAEKLAEVRAQQPRKHVLCIPAALAFGSGEHSTTAMCLRLLDGIARVRAGSRWTMLDLGTGSGVLALAARVLGAATAQGLDYDPPCIRTARENARTNAVSGATFSVADVQRWEPRRQWDVVAANLFSNLLVSQMPKLARALAPDGDLLLSGLLVHQLDEVLAAARNAKLKVHAVKGRGRWRALHLGHPRRAGTNRSA